VVLLWEVAFLGVFFPALWLRSNCLSPRACPQALVHQIIYYFYLLATNTNLVSVYHPYGRGRRLIPVYHCGPSCSIELNIHFLTSRHNFRDFFGCTVLGWVDEFRTQLCYKTCVGKLKLRSHPHLFTILTGGLGSFPDRMTTVRGLLLAFIIFYSSVAAS